MENKIKIVILVLAIIAVIIGVIFITIKPQKLKDLGDFKFFYEPISKAEYVQYEQIFKESGLFEGALDGVNFMKLPFDVPVVLKECGMPDTFYDPNNAQIVMCYELIDQIATDLAEASETEEERELRIINTVMFLFYHELGHAIIDIYGLPITGKEEDAADQLSTIMLIQTSGEEGEKAVLDGAQWFLLRAGKTDLSESAFADEHALDAQRFYNLACWIYGNNPEAHADIVDDGYLPRARAVGCQDEFARISTSWISLLTPYFK